MKKPDQKSQKERLEIALKVFKNPILRLQARRIYEQEMKGCSIFWSEQGKNVEFVGDSCGIEIYEP